MSELLHHIDLLDREIQVAQNLLLAIADEKSALSSRDPAQLQQASASKQVLVEELQQATQSRLNQLEGAEAKNQIDSNQQVRDRRDSLSAVAMECFESNRLVGQLINRRASVLAQSIHILQAVAPKSDLTYESTGGISKSAGNAAPPFRRV